MRRSPQYSKQALSPTVQQLIFSTRSYSCSVWCLLGLCILVSPFLLPAPSSKALQLQQQNASLSQAATLSRQLRELTLGHLSHQALASAFRQASLLAQQPSNSTHLQQASSLQQHTSDFRLLVSKATQIISAISIAKPVASCVWDVSLPLDLFKRNNKVLLAANMHNNEDLLPHFTVQMLHFLTSVPSGSAFLSIYESGSTDSTGMQLWCTLLFAFATLAFASIQGTILLS